MLSMTEIIETKHRYYSMAHAIEKSVYDFLHFCSKYDESYRISESGGILEFSFDEDGLYLVQTDPVDGVCSNFIFPWDVYFEPEKAREEFLKNLG